MVAAAAAAGMNAQARALEEEVLGLCDRVPDAQTAAEKQRLYSRVGRFLMGSFNQHWWCSYPTLMTFMMRILELHPGPESVRLFYDKMAQQLGLCVKCVDIYHSALPSVRVELEFEFTSSSVKDFFHRLSHLDAERLHQVFGRLDAAVTTALYEILSHRRLWSDFRIIRVISKWLSVAPQASKDAIDLETLRPCVGIYHWLVSPDPGIRAWATATVQRLGAIDLASGAGREHPFDRTLDEWMFILESSAFNTSLLSLDLPAVEELPMFLDATNCVKTPTIQILWAALDTVMQKMDENSVEAMLESFDNLPDLVFNYLNDADPASTNPQVTFVICKCYGSLLKCLGHRYWNHTVHAPKSVLDMIIEHCKLPSWRVFVTKQLIELLPPLVASMRPPSVALTNEANKVKMNAYFADRERVLTLLLHPRHRPSHFSDQVLSVATSKAVSTIICDSYEPRLLSSVSTSKQKDDGALLDANLVDFSVSDSSILWPCGQSLEALEETWANHLFQVLVNPEHVASLVDHVAITCATVLSKHLHLVRDAVYSCLLDSSKQYRAIIKSKPVIPKLLEKLCSWNTVATIPIAVHGALFESIGGVSELLNVLGSASGDLITLRESLVKVESLVWQYLQRIGEEVLVKGLTNPLRFPIVVQHVNICLLSPTPHIDQTIKRMLANAAASKSAPDRVPSPLEAFLVIVHRNTEAFLRGVLNLLQSLKLFDFALPITIPIVKKTIFTWMKVFEMLGNDVRKVISPPSSSSSDLPEDLVNLQKIPTIIGDFVAQLLYVLYGSGQRDGLDEAVLIQILDFGIAYWTFWTKDDDSIASSKRYSGLVQPLIQCIEERGGAAEKRRAAELLMLMLEVFYDRQTRLDDPLISRIENVKGGGSIESRKSTDFRRMATKLRQVSKTSRFFVSKTPKSRRRSPELVDLTQDEPSPRGSGLIKAGGSLRPMSGKAAAREQARLAMERSASTTIFEASAKHAHSFYTEDDLVAPSRPSSAKQQKVSPKQNFSISQVVNSISHSHGIHTSTTAARRDETAKQSSVQTEPEEDDDDDEEEEVPNLAAHFYKIKHTQKPAPACSMLPFYRHLLQVCMPSLLTKEFENEKSDREFQVPPLTFSKSSEYISAFLPLLLEECHNEVQESLRRCYFNGAGHVLRYESEKNREGMRCISLSVVEAANDVGNKKPGDRFGRREKLFRNADVVLLRSTNNRQHVGSLEFLGVIVISENERGKRRQQGGQGQARDEEEVVKVYFLNDGELESSTSEVPSFKMEALTANAIGDTEWRVSTLCNLVTSSREYVALRSVDTLPDHLRTTILTPNVYKTTQTELLAISTALDNLRIAKGVSDNKRPIVKLLKKLDKMDVALTDLRSTSIGKTVNKLRKHDDSDVAQLSNRLKEKWTALMDEKDALEHPPRFVSKELWDAIRPLYNQSQLQSVHSVLNNYSIGISLLQGPPGTGKTKTIMGLLSGFLAMKMPPLAVMPKMKDSNHGGNIAFQTSHESKPTGASSTTFNNFDLVREIAAKQSAVHTPGATGTSFSLSGVAASSRILRRSDSDNLPPKPTTLQALKNAASSRSRLEQKMASRTPSSSASVVRRTLLAPTAMGGSGVRQVQTKGSNVLLCAPSNGAVDELVLRIVTDGLRDSSGKVVKVRAPSVHPDSVSSEWLSIVRLGHPGEDAPDIVKCVCLPNIIKQELEIHPKTIELRSLQERQRTLRSSIREFHNKKAENGEEKVKGARKGLAKMHQELTEVSGKVRRLRSEVNDIESKMTAMILSRASIIACTLSKAGSGPLSGLQRGFDALIVDEAAQAIELSTLVPIRERVARVVLVGDPKQLPATVKSVAASTARYDRSLFERIAESGVAPSMLRVQYRMHPFLREFPSKRFYGGMLADGPSVMERVQQVCQEIYKLPYFQPFLLYDLVNTREEDFNGSKYNKSEAVFCVDLCKNMYELCADVRAKKWSVGFVSPYKEQVRVIRQEVNRSAIPPNMSIEVNTVDGFQGREKDVIIFSCVRSSERGGIGFLRDIRRLNVAITRARFCLFVVGNVRTLRRDDTWNALVDSARERKLILRAKSNAFADVVRDLERDDQGLRQHFLQMHDKLNKKTTATATTGSTAGTPRASGKSPTIPSGSEKLEPQDTPQPSAGPVVIEAKPTENSNDSAMSISTSKSSENVVKRERTDDKHVESKRQRTADTATALSPPARPTVDHRERSHHERDRDRDSSHTQHRSDDRARDSAKSDRDRSREARSSDRCPERRDRSRDRTQPRDRSRSRSRHSRGHHRASDDQRRSEHPNGLKRLSSREDRDPSKHARTTSKDQPQRQGSEDRSHRHASEDRPQQRHGSEDRSNRHKPDDRLQHRHGSEDRSNRHERDDRGQGRSSSGSGPPPSEKAAPAHSGHAAQPTVSKVDLAREEEHRRRQERLLALKQSESGGAASRIHSSRGSTGVSRPQGRIVTLTRSTSSSSEKPPANAGGGKSLLSSILGSSAHLATATSRLQNKAAARRDN